MLKNPKYIYGPCDRFVPASLNYGQYFLTKLKENSGKIALINGLTDEKLTYDDIAQEAINVSFSLTRMGVRKGDVIAVSSENRREYWSTVVGIICSGAVVTTINIGYTNDELKHVVGISKPKYLFCSPLAYKMHSKTYRSLGFLKHIILYGDEELPGAIPFQDLAVPSNRRTSHYHLELNVNFEDFEPIDVGGYDTLFILYSSGTTGLPKGVMITHQNILTLSCSNVILPPLLGLTITPWYHTMGLIGTLNSFSRGNTTVFLPKFNVEQYLRTVEKYKIEQLVLVPAALVALVKSSLDVDTSSVHLIYCGSAPLYEDTAKAVTKRFPNVTALLQGYGMTETTLAITMNYNPDKYGSVGTVTSHTVVKVVDPDTKEVLGPNKPGEICLKSATMMKGYVGRPRSEGYDEEGFFRTGDIGYYDEDGYFYIVDRLKELIKYKSYQVPPAEIETTLLKHPSVLDAGVVGVPHPVSGEVPVAFVVKSGPVTEAELVKFVAERLSNPKHIRGGVIFIDEIPRNQTSKILRKELRKMVKTRKSKL
ncbi:uncharacterized protein LOC116776292 [Danaus plexippus]|uniref:uncharacterized protein LOC116776292 n=1 Tax=Danaus plexippus TaxID=13037 RepID=UPI002AB0480D|nr:uncharacterized protein LOC116776292 [Danaus plexippus]